MNVHIKTITGAVLFVFMFFTSTGQNSAITKRDDAVIEKVKKAMLCMQRYSWEQGIAMQGMLEIAIPQH